MGGKKKRCYCSAAAAVEMCHNTSQGRVTMLLLCLFVPASLLPAQRTHLHWISLHLHLLWAAQL